MFVTRYDIPVTTLADGSATVFSQDAPVGSLLQYTYVPDGVNPLTNTASATLTGETTGVPVATIAAVGASAVTKGIRQAGHDIAGAASLYAAAGTPVNVPVVLARERIKIVIAGGGNVKSGTFYLWVG